MESIRRDFTGPTCQEWEGDPSSSSAPLSYGQSSLWFLHHLAPSGGAYVIAAAVRVRTPIEAGTLKRAFQALVDRHPALRTHFPTIDGVPYQQVAGSRSFALACEDAAQWNEESLRSRMAAEAWRPFDLQRGPLLRVTLFTGDPHGPVILLAVHHIVADFWSLAILFREFPALYREAAGEGAAELPPPGLPYEEHVRREREAMADPRSEAMLAYWRERLAGLPTLDLPLDRPRPIVQTYRGDCSRLRLPGDLSAALRARSRERHGTLFMTLVAAFQVLLSRYSGQEDLAIGAPRAGRFQSQFAGTVGYFVNPVVLRADLAGDCTFAELVERTKATVLAAFEHGEYPLPLLAQHLEPVRDASRTPLFQVSLVMQKETRGAEGLTVFALGEEGVEVGPEDFRLESLSLDRPPTPFDLQLHLVERRGELSLALQYNVDLFDRSTAARCVEHFATLLVAIVASPDLALSLLPILSAAERHQLLVERNGSALPASPSDALTLHGLFEAQAARTPDAVALVAASIAGTGERWTYRELDGWADLLAHRLECLGLGAEVRVGICLTRTPLLVASLLAVLKAGGAYVPLDPDYPSERLAFMLEDSEAAVLLTEPGLVERLPATRASSSWWSPPRAVSTGQGTTRAAFCPAISPI